MRVPFIASVAALAVVLFASVAGAATDPLGLTTVDQRIVPDGETGFDQLEVGPGEPYVVREDGFGAAQAGRESRRSELAYFGQLSDFQLADEESPARVEFVDPVGAPVEAAFRPWEALQAFIDDSMIRQLDAFAPAGSAPVAAGDGSRARDGLHDRHRRLGRQPAAQRDRMGEDPARGRRHSTPTAASTRPATRIRSARRSACRVPRRPPNTPASRTTTTTPRASSPTSTTPTNRAGPRPAGPNTRG